MRLIQIYKADLLNGVGLRNVYFFSYCPHHCPDCFNKETWELEPENSRVWTEDDLEELIKDAEPEHISGITLSGGDCLSDPNIPEVLELCKKFKEKFGETKTIWAYTGYTWENIMKNGGLRRECMDYLDVLCDGPFISSLKSPSKPWVGSENQRVIDVKKSLIENKVILYGE